MSERQDWTPEPWATNEEAGVTNPLYSGLIASLEVSPERLIAVVVRKHQMVEPRQYKANARRIVACVNALVGVDTERLELMEPGRLAKLFEDHWP